LVEFEFSVFIHNPSPDISWKPSGLAFISFAEINTGQLRSPYEDIVKIWLTWIFQMEAPKTRYVNNRRWIVNAEHGSAGFPPAGSLESAKRR